MNVTQTGSLFNTIQNNYSRITAESDSSVQITKPWAAMTGTEKFLHIITVGIWSPTIPQDVQEKFVQVLDTIVLREASKNSNTESFNGKTIMFEGVKVSYANETFSLEENNAITIIVSSEDIKKQIAEKKKLFEASPNRVAFINALNLCEDKNAITNRASLPETFFNELNRFIISSLISDTCEGKADLNIGAPVVPPDNINDEFNTLFVKSCLGSGVRKSYNDVVSLLGGENFKYRLGYESIKGDGKIYVECYFHNSETTLWYSSGKILLSEDTKTTLLSTMVSKPDNIQLSPAFPNDLFDTDTEIKKTDMSFTNGQWDEIFFTGCLNTVSIDELKQASLSVQDKKCSHLFYKCLNTELFTNLGKDLLRATNDHWYFNGNKISDELINKIVGFVITEKGKLKNINSWPPRELMNGISDFDLKNQEQVCTVIRDPRFVPALLAVVAQGLGMWVPVISQVKMNTSITAMDHMGVAEATAVRNVIERMPRRYEINLNNENNILGCIAQYITPYIDNKFKGGANKLCSVFSVPDNLTLPSSTSELLTTEEVKAYEKQLCRKLVPLVQAGFAKL
ncbi:hypothetical protein DPI70_23195 [Escherichia coli]|nr:hypothetical protein [Escherichia coli]